MFRVAANFNTETQIEILNGTAEHFPDDADAVSLLEFVEVCAVVLVDAAAVAQDGVAGHDPGAVAQLGGRGGEGRLQRVRVAGRDAHLDGAAPGVDFLVDAHLENRALRQLSEVVADFHFEFHLEVYEDQRQVCKKVIFFRN